MLNVETLAALAAEIERDPRFAGRRVADIPELADCRRRARWRFYRLADAGLVLLIWNFLAAAWASSPAWIGALVCAGVNVWMILFSESRARIISRQLNRPAAAQAARDLLGVQG